MHGQMKEAKLPNISLAMEGVTLGAEEDQWEGLF